MKSEIEKELLQYFMRLNESQKHSLLELVKSFLDTGGEPLHHISVEQYNRELDEAMERINKGDFTTLEELEKEINWHCTSEEINLLHNRREKHLNGSSKSVTAKESLNAVRRQKK